MSGRKSKSSNLIGLTNHAPTSCFKASIQNCDYCVLKVSETKLISILNCMTYFIDTIPVKSDSLWHQKFNSTLSTTVSRNYGKEPWRLKERC